MNLFHFIVAGELYEILCNDMPYKDRHQDIITCPHCNERVNTVRMKSIGCKEWCCACIMGILCSPSCKKDLVKEWEDVTHWCPNCKTELGNERKPSDEKKLQEKREKEAKKKEEEEAKNKKKGEEKL